MAEPCGEAAACEGALNQNSKLILALGTDQKPAWVAVGSCVGNTLGKGGSVPLELVCE